MSRRLFVLFALAALFSGPVRAARELQSPAVVLSHSNLLRSTFTVGKSAVEVLAGPHVDSEALLAGLDLSQANSAQAISDRVDQARKLLYPEEEIILSVTLPQETPRVLPASASLVRAIYWWNNTTCDGCYWFAEYQSTAATMFISEIEYGAYDLYYKIGGGNWIYKYFAPEGSSATLYSVGSRTNRGFSGVASEGASKAHIVMYFFK